MINCQNRRYSFYKTCLNYYPLKNVILFLKHLQERKKKQAIRSAEELKKKNKTQIEASYSQLFYYLLENNIGRRSPPSLRGKILGKNLVKAGTTRTTIKSSLAFCRKNQNVAQDDEKEGGKESLITTPLCNKD